MWVSLLTRQKEKVTFMQHYWYGTVRLCDLVASLVFFLTDFWDVCLLICVLCMSKIKFCVKFIKINLILFLHCLQLAQVKPWKNSLFGCSLHHKTFFPNSNTNYIESLQMFIIKFDSNHACLEQVKKRLWIKKI